MITQELRACPNCHKTTEHEVDEGESGIYYVVCLECGEAHEEH